MRKFKSTKVLQAGRRDSISLSTTANFPNGPIPEDEAPIENSGRLLQDNMGRMCNYIKA